MEKLDRSKVGRWVLASVFIILLFGISGCDKHKMDGKLVRDMDGKVYMLDNRIGNAYALREIDTLEIKRIENWGEDAE